MYGEQQEALVMARKL